MIYSKPALVWDAGAGGPRFCDWEERRRSGQTPTSLHVVKVQCEHYEGSARLQNISDEGMMLRHRLPICLGDVITVQITNADRVEGTVVWRASYPGAGQGPSSGFVEGLPVKVVLGEGFERRGVMRWSKGGIASIHLTSHEN